MYILKLEAAMTVLFIGYIPESCVNIRKSYSMDKKLFFIQNW
jgi:hypothetical protein